MPPKHPWGVRLTVAFIMLALAFLGMVVTDVKLTGGFDYWKWVIPVYAVLALWLSWYVRRRESALRPVTLGHELLHWIGLVAAVFLVSTFFRLGLISRFIAGLFDLTLLSLAVFLAGVYIETTFFFIGIALGLFAFVAAAFIETLYALIIPVLVATAITVAIAIWLSHRRHRTDRNG